MAWRFDSKEDYISRLVRQAEHERTMATRWEQAISERKQPRGKVYFSYMEPVSLRTAREERIRHIAWYAALMQAADMAKGLPPHN